MNKNELKDAVRFCEMCQKLLELKLSEVREKLALLQKSDSANTIDILRLREDDWSLNLDIFVFRLASSCLEKLIETCEE